MTEKRFYYARGIIFDTHKDNHINKIGTIKDLDIGLRIVNWLNELNDENEQLKDEYHTMQELYKFRLMYNALLFNVHHLLT